MKNDKSVNTSQEEELQKIIYGFCASQCLYVAASLGIADRIGDSSCSAAEIADFTQAHPASVQRLLLALTNIGILDHDEQGSYRMTTMGSLLRSDAKGSRKAEILHMLQPSSWQPWGHLLDSIRSGRPSFPEIFGTDAWTYRAQNPDASTLFQEMAAAMSRRESDAVLNHLDLTHAERVADIGGGNGAFLTQILMQHRELSGILFDLPAAISGAVSILEAAGLKDRCQIVTGDFFDRVPERCDIYLLKSVIHNWSDEAAVSILKNCRRAMDINARIILIEAVNNPQTLSPGSFLDLHMLVIHGGKLRTAEEYGRLLESSGFRLASNTPAGAGIGLLEGTPV